MKEEKLKTLTDMGGVYFHETDKDMGTLYGKAVEAVEIKELKQELGMKRILEIRTERRRLVMQSPEKTIERTILRGKHDVLMEIFDITEEDIKEAEEQERLRAEDQIIADLDAERTIAEADAEAQARGEAEDKANAEYDARDELESQEDKYYEEHHQ
jgi:hypothetical protein